MSILSDGNNKLEIPYACIDNPNEFFNDYLERNYKGEVSAADMLELKNLAVSNPIFLTYCITNHTKVLPFNISLLYMTQYMFTEDFYSEYSSLSYDKSIPITSMLLDWLYDLPYYDILADYNRVYNIYNNLVSIRDLKSKILRDISVNRDIMTTTHITISSINENDINLSMEDIERKRMYEDDTEKIIRKITDYILEHINSEVGVKNILLGLISENNFQDFKSVFRRAYTRLCYEIENALDIEVDDNLANAIGKTLHYICNIVVNNILISNLEDKITCLSDSCTLAEILYDVFQINRNVTQITKLEWSDIYEL